MIIVGAFLNVIIKSRYSESSMNYLFGDYCGLFECPSGQTLKGCK